MSSVRIDNVWRLPPSRIRAIQEARSGPMIRTSRALETPASEALMSAADRFEAPPQLAEAPNEASVAPLQRLD